MNVTPTTLTLAVLLAVPVLLVMGLWVRNYQQYGSAPRATSRTSNRVVGLVSAVVLSIAIALSSVAGLAGVFGDLVSMFPGGVAQLALGGLAIAGISGILELGVVGATVIVVLIVFGTAAVRNKS